MNDPANLFSAPAGSPAALNAQAPASTSAAAGSTKGSRGEKPGKKKDKLDSEFSQFSWTKSLSVSNAPLQACIFEQTRQALQSLDAASMRLSPLIESDELGVTGRKDSKSAGSDEEKVTFAQARYATLPPGADAVLITFDLKVHNATTLPQSANLGTWEKLCEAGGAICGGQSMSIHQALTSRAADIFALIAQQVYSGQWAWRNHQEATQTQVFVLDEAGRAVTSAQQLGQGMYEAFSSKSPAIWKVRGLFKLGTGSSRIAFPSQLLKTSGSKRDKSIAEFYRIPTPDGQGDFALRAVKVGNRLKAIDTWYERYALLGQAIPVEPMGYAHNLRATLRKSGETAVDILERLVRAKSAADKTMSDNEALYLTAITLFGGLITAEKQEKAGDGASDDGGEP